MRRCALRIVAGACVVAGLLTTGVASTSAAQDPFAGMSWHMTSTLPKGTLTASYVYSIACPSTQDCFAVGGAGQIASQSNVTATARIGRSRNGGRTWVWGKAKANTNLVQIACESTKVCVTVGSAASPTALALMTTNGGSSWHAMTVPAGTATFWSVACTSKACVAGTGDEPGLAGSILRVRGTSKSFEPVPVAWPAGVVTQSVFSLTCPKRTSTCYGIGTDASSATSTSAIGAYVLSSSNGGTSWSVATAATGASTTEGPTFFSCISLKDCEYGGQGGTTLYATKTGFAGSTPLHAIRPSSVPVKWGVACLSATHCELAGAVNGSSGSAATASSLVGPWTAQSLPAGTADLQDIVCPSSTTCLAASVGDPVVSDTTSPRLGGILRLH